MTSPVIIVLGYVFITIVSVITSSRYWKLKFDKVSNYLILNWAIGVVLSLLLSPALILIGVFDYFIFSFKTSVKRASHKRKYY